MLFLFERLSVTPRLANGGAEPFGAVAMTMAQVQRIVATGRLVGDTAPVVRWGMEPISTLGVSATERLTLYAKALNVAIERYEPRLSSVKVEIERSDDELMPYRLVVTALFPGEEKPRDLRVAAPY